MRKITALAAYLGAVLVVCAAQSASPLSPSAERETFHLADSNLVVEIVASEPQVRAPVALAWDASLRLFVAEMTDYPSGPVSGRIRLLEDRDGDGFYERATVFATNLAFPNGVMPWKNGVLVTAAPDIWFLADTNNDGVADVREKVLTGFAEGNQQLRVNGLYWGIDNWIYGANGRSDGEVRWSSGSPAQSIRRRDFRFRPDTREFEAVAGNSQFGMGRDDWGNRFPVFNNTPVRHVVLEDRYLQAQSLLAGTDVTPSISPAEGGNRVFALTPPALLIPQPVGFFTSACGPSVYRGSALPSEYRGNAFVCEPVQNLVQRRILVPNGATFTAEFASTNAEFLASTDPWFHGVFTATGPDGAFYVVDMYREWVEHPHWVAPEIRDKVDWRKGEENGRIWRVRGRDARIHKTRPLATASNADLAASLTSENGWTRDTAHRLLVERNARYIAPELEKLARGASPEAAVHALHILDAWDFPLTNLLASALAHANPRVREHAALLVETGVHNHSMGTALLAALGRETDARARLQMLCSANMLDGLAGQRQSVFIDVARRRDLDDWQITALLAGAGARPWGFLQAVTADSSPEKSAHLYERCAALIAAGADVNDCREFLQWVGGWHSPSVLTVLGAFLDGSRSAALRPVIKSAPLEAIRSAAKTAIADRTVDFTVRQAGIKVLAAIAPEDAARMLPALLQVEEPALIQVAASRALLELNDTNITQSLFERWSTLPKPARAQLLGSATRSSLSASALLQGVEQGRIGLVEVDALTRQGIERTQDKALKARAVTLFSRSLDADREAVVQRYKPALLLSADRKHGAAVFEKNCAVCHQMQGAGARIGPDLSGIGTQTRESLLIQILDPSRQVLPDYVAFTAETKSGDTYIGFVSGESASSVTLRRANEPDITLQRAEIVSLKTSGKSIMPDGLEAAISQQDMADLIEFLRRPDRTLFTEINSQPK